MKLKIVGLLVCLFIIFSIFPSSVYADYVLPYPSYMPGNKLYKPSRFFDAVQKFWYWGNIASFKYRLKLADKYLVEAKTLFEYRQYLLGVDALKRSNQQIPYIKQHLESAKNEDKNIDHMRILMVSGMDAHIKTLEGLSAELPSDYQWVPEKQSPTSINFTQLLQETIATRRAVME
ncbi:MAG: hypothetical protein UY16_C0001G0025 [Candidatus Gottesmanbacteria bacterium GW2011_GWA2_47_9]|uniref:DUF5667 domain-containing protein n=2 Tax=Microgenomates group TaxID=1794810 RepID=A0A0G0UVD8_9BACT|nr:MAG: hypothetical protein UU42_C0010G0006 [Candidatus Woesebacteria bacterium GW2011_GWA1_41_13b]KKU88871.1 MAG: hypothetical protein UY16_C0001G0025 [Candidatus Gottesmanbacteria bacterium GW2011_GWA2_47_9]